MNNLEGSRLQRRISGYCCSGIPARLFLFRVAEFAVGTPATVAGSKVKGECDRLKRLNIGDEDVVSIAFIGHY